MKSRQTLNTVIISHSRRECTEMGTLFIWFIRLFLIDSIALQPTAGTARNVITSFLWNKRIVAVVFIWCLLHRHWTLHANSTSFSCSVFSVVVLMISAVFMSDLRFFDQNFGRSVERAYFCRRITKCTHTVWILSHQVQSPFHCQIRLK